jgi:hypothetical protein
MYILELLTLSSKLLLTILSNKNLDTITNKATFANAVRNYNTFKWVLRNEKLGKKKR